MGPLSVVVGYDARDHSQDALALGALLVEASGGNSLGMAHVMPRNPRAVSRSYEYRGLRSAALEEMLQRGRRNLPPGIGARTFLVASESAGRGLHDLAVREGFEVVAVGSTHRGSIGSGLAGTTAERLVDAGGCGVAVAPVGLREREARLETIAFAPDSVGESQAARRWATALATSCGAAVRPLDAAHPADGEEGGLVVVGARHHRLLRRAVHTGLAGKGLRSPRNPVVVLALD